MFFSLFRRSGWPLLAPLFLLLLSGTNPTKAQSNDTATIPNASATGTAAMPAMTNASLNCSESQTSKCLEEFRVCFEESCGDCREGYVAIPEQAKQLRNGTTSGTDTSGTALTNANATTYCVPIEDLKLALYDELFAPIYYAYTSLQAEERLDILLDVANFVSQHNSQLPKPSYSLGLNQYSADTPEEAQRLGGYVVPEEGGLVLDYLIAKELENASEEGGKIPVRRDWVEEGAVTSVKDQGRCGGCWAVSICGAIEGAAAITSNFEYLQSLSFQQLISCDKTNGGCNGGFPASALAYANKNRYGGTATLNDYPFTDGQKGEATQECAASDKDIAVDSQVGTAITYYGAVGDDSYDIRMQKMKQGVARQPVAIAVKSECKTFKNYKSGVVTDDGDCHCKPQDVEGCLDHAVLLVGYDDEPENGDEPYWKIKNSWGTDWGEDGYIRIAQYNPNPFPDSWGLFGVLAEGVVPLRAYNQTEEVYDKPQEVGLDTWEKVLVLAGAFVGAAILGIGLAVLKQKMCSQEAA